jgi:hypothetical protein
MSGRRRGRCRNTATSLKTTSETQSVAKDEVVYGVGRGGRPRGGGKGHLWGGGRNKNNL